jgi:hypothetical protein
LNPKFANARAAKSGELRVRGTSVQAGARLNMTYFLLRVSPSGCAIAPQKKKCAPHKFSLTLAETGHEIEL